MIDINPGEQSRLMALPRSVNVELLSNFPVLQQVAQAITRMGVLAPLLAP